MPLDVCLITNQNSHYMREPKQQRSQRTLQRILAAAIELFERQGVDSTSITDVAKLARSSVGSLYGRFEGKTDLVRAVDRLLWQRVAVRWSGATDVESTAGDAEVAAADALGADSATAGLLWRLHHALAPEHLARASIDDFLKREGRESEGPAVLKLLGSEVQAALAERVAPAESSDHSSGILGFLARVAVEEANAGRGVGPPAEAGPKEIGQLSAGDPLADLPDSGHLAFVVEATISELGGGRRVPETEPKRSAPAMEPFDIWA